MPSALFDKAKANITGMANSWETANGNHTA
jgi:hypothetical protein